MTSVKKQVCAIENFDEALFKLFARAYNDYNRYRIRGYCNMVIVVVTNKFSGIGQHVPP